MCVRGWGEEGLPFWWCGVLALHTLRGVTHPPTPPPHTHNPHTTCALTHAGDHRRANSVGAGGLASGVPGAGSCCRCRWGGQPGVDARPSAGGCRCCCCCCCPCTSARGCRGQREWRGRSRQPWGLGQGVGWGQGVGRGGRGGQGERPRQLGQWRLGSRVAERWRRGQPWTGRSTAAAGAAD